MFFYVWILFPATLTMFSRIFKKKKGSWKLKSKKQQKPPKEQNTKTAFFRKTRKVTVLVLILRGCKGSTIKSLVKRRITHAARFGMLFGAFGKSCNQ